MIAGLRLPFLSEEDPEVAAEGGIDPLGLAPIADRLADEIAPGVTARMSRIRYLTAICAAARVLEPFRERAAPDGTPPYLVLEWIVVEAFARRGGDLPGDGRQIPGIDKARTALLRNERISARNYLKTPKVFGFHGVYRTLAEALRLVDSEGYLRDGGERLARIWEREQDLDGFLDARAGLRGGALRARLDEAIDQSLSAGENRSPPTSSIHEMLLTAFRPDGASRPEKSMLHELLLDEREPIRREVILGLSGNSLDAGESDYAEILLRRASPRLRDRLIAIQRFEALSEKLVCAFDRVAFLSTTRGTTPLTADHVASDAPFLGFIEKVPSATLAAREGLERLESIQMLDLFAARLAKFEERVDPREFFRMLLEHHEQTQRQKKPRGKRPWYETAGDGVVIRFPYRRDDSPEEDGRFIHPFRFSALLHFLEDLA